MNIKELLIKGIQELENKKIEDSKLKVKMLLCYYLNVSKEYLIIHNEEDVNQEVQESFFKGIKRLCENEPIQYIVNSQEFMGMEFYVDKNVLIPQPDTEILVEEVIRIANTFNVKIKILDLCTGSGAIGVCIAKKIKNAEVYASDISSKALEVAKKNSANNEVSITFIKSDIFNNINSNIRFDIIVSNPPYIETNVISSLSEEVKKEPMIALDGGKDGLYFYNKIVNESIKYLDKNGILALEIGYNQEKAVTDILKKNEFESIYSKRDLGGNSRIVVGKRS